MESVVRAMDSLKSFYRNKRIWVTGHTGFKGSWLCLWLESLGAKVAGYALDPEAGRPSLYQMADLPKRMHSIIADIRNAAAVQQTLSDWQPEIVFHLAAQPLVRRSYREPIETYNTNIMGTVHVLEAARNVDSVKAILNVTTDKCYENKEWFWPYRENDALGGDDPYSSSKAASEIVTAAYDRSFLRPMGKYVATARAGNVIGGGDFSEDRIIPDFIRAVKSAQPLSIRFPRSIRPWQHVLDAVHGYLLLGKKLYEDGPGFAEAFNFSPQGMPGIQVKAVIDGLIAYMGCGSYVIDADAPQLHEARLLQLDSSKAQARLNWQVLLDWEHTLALTAEWYAAWLEGKDMSAVTLKQIHYLQEVAISR